MTKKKNPPDWVAFLLVMIGFVAIGMGLSLIYHPLTLLWFGGCWMVLGLATLPDHEEP